MKIKYLLLLIGLALALPVTQATAQLITGSAGLTSGIVGSVHDFTIANSGTTNYSWNVYGETCQVCHTPHGADLTSLAGQAGGGVPLWIHATTPNAGNFVLYADPNPVSGEMAGITMNQPSGISLACLSCHDGQLAINQSTGSSYSGAEYPNTATAGATLAILGESHGSNHLVVTGGTGNSLQGMHPISFTYPTTTGTTFLQATTTTIAKATMVGQAPGAALNLGVNNTDIWPGGTTSPTIGTLLYNGKVECASCHDVHNQIGDAPGDHFLLKVGLKDYDSTNRGDTLCRTCHIK